MKKRTRSILFVICVILFLLIAPVVVLYSQGYRFDFQEKRVTQTGAFYFKVLPENAEIYINGKFKNTTSAFTNSSLIKNLVPRTYNVEIKKQGYHIWQKNLEVREKQVAEAKNIVLIPKNPNLNIIDQMPEIEITATSSDQKKVIDFNDHEIWVLFPEKEEKVFITRFSEKIGDVFWLNNHYLIFNVNNKIKVAEIDTRDKINIVDLTEFKSPEIFWDQKDENLYILSQNNLYLLKNLLP